MFKCRASQLKKLMTEPKLKADKEAGNLSETARTMVREQLLLDLFGFKNYVETKYTRKGIMLEAQAIDVIGLATFTEAVKNTERKENDWITGECDIVQPDCIRDTKCSWSIDTFPWTKAEAGAAVKDSGYDWQGQAYMWLWDKPRHYVDYVLLPTPHDLLGFYDEASMYIYAVEAIPMDKRITSVIIERDESLHELIIAKVKAARLYYDALKNEIEG
jgi:hypothetical protein